MNQLDLLIVIAYMIGIVAVGFWARRKITSQKRNIVEGSDEWNILFRRYRDEELRKKGILK